jgi:hypothetical protein
MKNLDVFKKVRARTPPERRAWPPACLLGKLALSDGVKVEIYELEKIIREIPLQERAEAGIFLYRRISKSF